VSISLHPGAIDTDLSRYASSLIQRAGRIVTYPVTHGAITSLYAGTAPAASELNGKVGVPSSIIGHDVPTYIDLVPHYLGTGHTSE